MENINEGCGKGSSKKKFNKTIKKMAKGKLKTSAGKKLNPKNEKDRRQGIAIAYSEADLSKKESVDPIYMPTLNEWIKDN
ncbi:MAG: hypothetical protein WC554_12350 [Clostridia bacterium]|jgi:hypothetical protein